jgi:DNA-binding beta-propeller fold protein YncE
MRFDGYIVLPKHGIFLMFDYLSIANRELFAAAMNTGTTFKVKLDDKPSVLGELKGPPSVHGAAVVPSRHLVFVSRSDKDVVDEFDSDTLERVKSIPVATGPDAIIYDPTTALVYVASGKARTGTLIDPSSATVLNSVRLPGEPEFPAMDGQTGLLYQNLSDTNSVAAVDLSKGVVVGQWSLAPCKEPSGLAIDPVARRAFIACMGNASLVVFDLDRHQVLAVLKTGRSTDSVAFDPGLNRIYAASAVGTMTVIEQESPYSYHLLGSVHTHLLAHTLAVDPATHKVYVAYPSLFLHPRIAVFSPLP